MQTIYENMVVEWISSDSADRHLERILWISPSNDVVFSIAMEDDKSFGLDPFSPCLFVFCNRERNKLKILYWEHNGFWLFYRRLERGTFQWPTGSVGTVMVSSRELRWLLDGLAISQRQAHPKVTAQTVI